MDFPWICTRGATVSSVAWNGARNAFSDAETREPLETHLRRSPSTANTEHSPASKPARQGGIHESHANRSTAAAATRALAARSGTHLGRNLRALACAAALACVAALAGCAGPEESSSNPQPQGPGANAPRVVATEDAGLHGWQLAFACNSSAFMLAQTEENACYSPLSLYYGLALLQQGAEGESLSELTGLLGASPADVAESCQSQMGQFAAYADRGALVELAVTPSG